jgi:RNA polymerase sigma-70 factor (ECF subfamily)
MDEREAVKRLKQGDIRGLETLVQTHQLRAIRAAYLVIGDRGAAEDVVQSAFLRAYERISQFDAARPFGPWFMRSVMNDAIKAAVRARRYTTLEPEEDKPLSEIPNLLIDPGPKPEELLEAAETREAIFAALQRLTPAQRAAIVQRYYLEMSEAEMSHSQARARGTIKAHLHAARERLRTLLDGSWLADTGDAAGIVRRD